MRKLILLLALIFFFFNGISQETPEQIIEKFWKNYESGDAIKTIDELYANSPWADRIKDELESIKIQFKDLPNLLGEFYGYELLITKQLGESYSIYMFLVKYERQPMRFQFEFYKPKDKWIMQGFSYDYDLDEDLEAAAKQELLLK